MQQVPARPYAWPYHGKLLPERTALLVCTDKCAKNAAVRDPVARLSAVLDHARTAGIFVVLLPDADGLPLFADVADAIVTRPRLGGFTGTDLDLVLRTARRTDLIFAGYPFELGAESTMREANDLGYECLLLEDCSVGLTRETFVGAVRSVQMSGGIFGAVAAAADVLDLLRFFNGGMDHVAADQV